MKQGFKVLHCDGDADVMIMLTTVEAAKTQDTLITVEDADLIVLLCHHANVEIYRIKSQLKKGAKSKPNVGDFIALQRDLGKETYFFLFGMHYLGVTPHSAHLV